MEVEAGVWVVVRRAQEPMHQLGITRQESVTPGLMPDSAASCEER